MMRSRTTTAPTCLRSQVERAATTRPIAMKYSSQLARGLALMFFPYYRGLRAAVKKLRAAGVDRAQGTWLVSAENHETLVRRRARLRTSGGRAGVGRTGSAAEPRPRPDPEARYQRFGEAAAHEHAERSQTSAGAGGPRS